MMSAAAPSSETLEAQITALGDEIRALKAAKGSKEEVHIHGSNSPSTFVYICYLALF
jgi:hypothetical protein